MSKQIGLFLHLYQPIKQQKTILEKVTEECYKPLIIGLEENPNAKVTINISGSLLDLFKEHGYGVLLEKLTKLVKSEQVELTGSAKYHSLK